MKKILPTVLFFIFCGLAYHLEADKQVYSSEPSATGGYIDGIHYKEADKYTPTALYNITAQLFPHEKIIEVNQTIVWKNTDSLPTKELWFHLYPNGYKSNNTLLAERYNLEPDNLTEIELITLKVDNKSSLLRYISLEENYPYDSTTAMVLLDYEIGQGESCVIEFSYRMSVPESVKRLGYARGREFYFISQWYPKLGVYDNGNWICPHFYPNTNFYSDFGDYLVNIKVPDKYRVFASGFQTDNVAEAEYITYTFKQKGVHDFVWLATDEINEYLDVHQRKDSTDIQIKLLLQPENSGYKDRYLSVLKYSLEYFEDHFGPYPYHSITCVDVPRTSASQFMEYPTLFTVNTDLFSREATLDLEENTVHEFIHQYFQGIVANNEVYEAWLDEGLATYLTTRAVSEKYGTPYVTFEFLNFLPVEGLNFLSYNEIPLIYTLGDYKYPEGYLSFIQYYKYNNIGAIADSSHKLPTVPSYYVNSYHKPEIMFLSLERIIGEDKLLNILKNYYEVYKFRHPSAGDLIEMIKSSVKDDLGWFFENCYYHNRSFDYSVTEINRITENKYQVTVERIGEGIFVNDIAFYTDKDTTVIKWDGEERWKRFEFITENEFIGAEVDPYRKNLFDINFANNSRTVEKSIWASLSFATRWFFWIQNALLIMGSVA